ncbi:MULTISPECIES: permease [unclassified Desulfovibrio]|uniref:permease n=1 Tax=unclassified Desulfovibrio TaxID=2593640 RepID=UPI000F5F0C3F|nr:MULTISPECIES: permease [unclassified Desulfovibrio]RRD71937.1 permease [Desulfovibrio sp. OH1209_COT-279]RRD88150.1 permease [Desulfovibrio sp. OH1186_COT-070]
MGADKQDLPGASCCCASPVKAPESADNNSSSAWNTRYFLIIVVLAALWWLAYSYILPASNWLVFGLFGVAPDSHLGLSLEFFIYDTVKILLLLVALIYGIAWIRASLNVERVRDYLAGKRRGLGYFLGATFGAVTPFCSCSSIPLFLGFTTARIPIGITMSFLITSPLINEIAVVLLWGLLGWKFTVLYVVVGMSAGIIGGFVMDGLKADRWLQPFIREAMENAPAHQYVNEAGEIQKLTVRQRHTFAYGEMLSIFKRVWKWVIIGVGIGAALHGFVPDNWFAENLGAGEWWTVPASVFVAIPLYSNVTGIVPIMESLLVKGLPIGTTMAFCMSAVAASIPEVMMLRQIMTIKLQAAFIGYLWIIFTLVGWLFNILGPYIV